MIWNVQEHDIGIHSQTTGDDLGCDVQGLPYGQRNPHLLFGQQQEHGPREDHEVAIARETESGVVK